MANGSTIQFMKKLLLLTTFILTACSGPTTTEITRDENAPALVVHTITTADPGVTLEVPDSALPDGLTAADISVEKLVTENGEVEYRLEPDGTKFKEKVKLMVDLPENERFPLFFHKWITINCGKF